MMMSEKEIPLDIVIEILKRLPTESLMKLMSVSKQWKSTIQSPLFIAGYHTTHIQPPNRIFAAYRSDVDIFDGHHGFLQPLTIPMPAHLLDLELRWFLGYSQGLFGFHCYEPKHDSEVVVIWNPSIRKSICIPIPEHYWKDRLCFTVCNGTDPTILSIPYHHSTYDKFVVDIFPLSTREWRTLSNDHAPRATLELGTARVVIDGFIHWIAHDRTPKGDLLNNLILSYDLTREQFTELCLPPSLAAPTSRANLDISRLGESLVVLEKYERGEEISVWMMMMTMEPGVQNPFTKLFTIHVPPRLRVLGFTKDGKPISQEGVCTDWSDFIPSEWKLLLYEPHSKCFKDIGSPGKGYAHLAGSYMETLLLLDH